MPTDEQLGKAYRAWEAYNFKQKKGRLESFELNRWLKVVEAVTGRKTLNGKQPSDKKGWVKELAK